MALTQIKSDGIANAAITTQQLAPGAAGGPKITQIQITDSGGTVLDDTAISLSGGYIKITGTGFAAGAQVIVNNTPATSTTFTSTTVLNAQVGAQSAGTYVVYVVNTDGGVAIAVNGLTYSSTPTWVTGSTLDNQITDVPISIQLSATGANTYSLDAGSSLPSGLTLSSGGLLSGTVSILAETTYSFTVNAIDTELQDSPRTFSLTVTLVIADPYFYLTTLLLPGNGTNNGTNNTFLDGSTNNFTITRNGNTTQGTISPFSLTGWSGYFDGNGDYLAYGAGNSSLVNWYSQSTTMEAWIYPTAYTTYTNGYGSIFTNGDISSNSNYWGFGINDNKLRFIYFGSGTNSITSTGSVSLNTWTHIAFVYNHSDASMKLFINGVLDGSGSKAGSPQSDGAIGLKTGGWNGGYFSGFISNARLVQGAALYSSNFTPSTTPLTAVANTSVLILQSNRFKDNSTNNFTITVNGDTSIQSFSPFNPTNAYSTSTVGGSAYFDGSGDYLSWSGSTIGTQPYTAELWFYANNLSGIRATFGTTATAGFNLRISSSTSISIDAYNNSAQSFTVPTMTVGQWYHLVAVRNASNQTTVFLNGVRSSTGAVSISTNYGAISKLGQSAELTDFNGYISGARLVIGSAVYDPTSSTISVPTTPPTAVANTNLLLNFTNGQITDATSKNNLETLGDVKISTAQSKWAGSSIAFDGTGDYLSLPTRYNFTFGSGDFTIEFWFRLNTINSGGVDSNTPCLFTSGWSWGVFGPLLILQAGSVLTVYASTDGANWAINNVIATSTLSANTWYHFAMVRSGTSVKYYLNGTANANTSTLSGSLMATSTNTTIGASATGSGSINGYMQDVRVTKYARYTTNFSVPTAAFPVQ